MKQQSQNLNEFTNEFWETGASKIKLLYGI